MEMKITATTDHKYLGTTIDPSLTTFEFGDGFVFEVQEKIVFIGGCVLKSANYIIVCQDTDET